MSSMPSSDAGPAGDSANLEAQVREALPAGTRLGDFEVVRTLGSGGFGTVYLAIDRSLQREVAIKEYLPAQLACRRSGSQQVMLRSMSFEASYCAGLRSFVNEARILARFNHPGIVKVHRFWESNGTAYMVMPYLRGPTLRDVRRSMKDPPTEAWLRGVIDPLLDALAMMHAEGVYHRDIAPDNILLPAAREPVLLDFGAARRVIGDRTQTLTAVLKPSYAPIEQYAEATQLRQGPWTDLYALGAVVVYMLNAVPPPPSTVRSMHDEMPRLMAEPPAGVSASFVGAVQWALAVRPQDRPQSVQQFRNALDGRIAVPVFHVRSPVPMDDHPTPADGPTWPHDSPAQVTTVAMAMHADEPSFEKPRSVTWDTTIRLASEGRAGEVDVPSLAATQVEPPQTARGLPAPVRARLARMRREATEWPRSALVVAGLAVLLASGAAFGLLRNRGEEPGVATWRELGRQAKNEVIIEERESDSRPVPPLAPPMQATTVATPAATTSVTADTQPLQAAMAAPHAVLAVKPVEPRSALKKPHRTKPARLAAPLGPREACGDRNFFSMAICINRKCDETAFKRHPQCIALARQREENARRWQH